MPRSIPSVQDRSSSPFNILGSACERQSGQRNLDRVPQGRYYGKTRNTDQAGAILDFVQLDARTVSVVTPATQAPIVGKRLTRYDIPELGDQEFAAAFGHNTWEVTEVVPLEDRPGWVKVYVRPAEQMGVNWGGASILPL